jgi:hypothetical protein
VCVNGACGLGVTGDACASPADCPTSTCQGGTCVDGVLDAGPLDSGATPDCQGAGCNQCVSRVFGRSLYWICDDLLSWDAAREECEDRGYHLAVLDDATEALRVRSWVDAELGGGSVWIGLGQRAPLGALWVDGTRGAYEPWDAGGSPCGVISAGDPPELAARECDDERRYVCEWEYRGDCAGDGDGDGFGAGCPLGDDCLDTDPTMNPGALDVCDGIDNDCVGGADDDPVGCRCPEVTTDAGTYEVCRVDESWLAARARCQSLGRDLVIIEDAAEMAAVLSARDQIVGTQRAWIGLHDQTTETSFEWVDGAPLGAYENWAIGQPSNILGLQDCVDMRSDGTWGDANCGETLPFVCE